jgi:hypothetical protein
MQRIELSSDSFLEADTFAHAGRAAETPVRETVMDIIRTIGFYTFVSMTLNAFNVPTGKSDPTPFPRTE